MTDNKVHQNPVKNSAQNARRQRQLSVVKSNEKHMEPSSPQRLRWPPTDWNEVPDLPGLCLIWESRKRKKKPFVADKSPFLLCPAPADFGRATYRTPPPPWWEKMTPLVTRLCPNRVHIVSKSRPHRVPCSPVGETLASRRSFSLRFIEKTGDKP